MSFNLKDIPWDKVTDASPPPKDLSDYVRKLPRNYRWNSRNKQAEAWCVDCDGSYTTLLIRPDTKEIICPSCLGGYWGTLPDDFEVKIELEVDLSTGQASIISVNSATLVNPVPS